MIEIVMDFIFSREQMNVGDWILSYFGLILLPADLGQAVEEEGRYFGGSLPIDLPLYDRITLVLQRK